jgi:hypothetical protein
MIDLTLSDLDDDDELEVEVVEPKKPVIKTIRATTPVCSLFHTIGLARPLALSCIQQGHPLNPNVVFDPDHSCFVVRGRKVSGLTTGFLKNNYYPTWDYTLAMAVDHIITQPTPSAPAPFQYKGPHSVTASTLIKRGMRRGKRVDLNLSAVLDLQRDYRIPARLFGYDPKYRVQYGRHPAPARTLAKCTQWIANATGRELQAAAKELQRVLGIQDPRLRLLVSRLESDQLIMIHCQFPVGCEALRLGTAIDLICVHQTSRQVILVEVKTGGANYLMKACGPLNPPFHEHNDCLLHQWFLQLAFTTELYRLTCPQWVSFLGTPRLYQLPNAADCHVYELPASISDKVPLALQQFRR